MDRYKFILEDYHAIKNANIILDGLTVLAGLNGCGKSTISRWLYGFVKYSNEYDHIVEDETAEAIYERNRRLVEIQRRIAFWTKSNLLPRIHNNCGSLEYEVSAFQARVHDVSELIENTMTEVLIVKYGRELRNSLDVKDEDMDLSETLNSFVNKEQEFLTNKIEEADKRKSECSLEDLYRIIENGLDIKSRGPLDMQLVENGTDLLDHDYEYLVDDGVMLSDNGRLLVTDRILGRFLAPMGLKRAIYIDSPMAISNGTSTPNKIWGDLKEMLAISIKPMPKEADVIIKEIELILGGELMLKDEGLGHKELRYVRRMDGLNISINEVATGMKSFAIILRLLQNGYIDDKTLLIIDEPEAHLHPQWIVKFAKVLVLIQKLLGAKVMVASHDPDMVAAINAMSEAEGLSGITNFYQAFKEPGELTYAYMNSGNDISHIFESFNIALDRIDNYKSFDSKSSDKF